MKRVIVGALILCSILGLCLFAKKDTNTLSVTDFGAVGDGATDNTTAINNALAAMHTQAKNLYFPPGVYACNTKDGNGNILNFNAAGMNNLAIYSNGGATITTSINSASTLLSISAFSKTTGLTISGLKFLNTHGKITGITTGIFLQGTSGEEIDTTYIQNDTLGGFSQGIGAQGVIGLWIQRNTFIAPHGHDDAQQNTQPAANIWLYDNGNGYCQNIFILKNTATGYTGTFPMNCPRPMDNFLYGTGYNYYVAGNKVKWYGQELISVAPVSTFPSTTLPVVITGNDLDCTLPPGSVNDDGSPHKINYGIRVDASNAIVKNNILTNYTWGLMVRGIDFPTLSPANYTFQYNTLNAPAFNDTTYSRQMAFFVQGHSSHPIPGVNISFNEVYNVDSTMIQVLNTTGAVTTPNTFLSVKVN